MTAVLSKTFVVCFKVAREIQLESDGSGNASVVISSNIAELCEWVSTSTSVAGVTAGVSVCAVAVLGWEPLVRRVSPFVRVNVKMLDLVCLMPWLVPFNHFLTRLRHPQPVNGPCLSPLSPRHLNFR